MCFSFLLFFSILVFVLSFVLLDFLFSPTLNSIELKWHRRKFKKKKKKSQDYTLFFTIEDIKLSTACICEVLVMTSNVTFCTIQIHLRPFPFIFYNTNWSIYIDTCFTKELWCATAVIWVWRVVWHNSALFKEVEYHLLQWKGNSDPRLANEGRVERVMRLLLWYTTFPTRNYERSKAWNW